MRKIILTSAIVLSAVTFSACIGDDTSQSTSDSESIVAIQEESTPSRAAEINGMVRSIEGNEVVIAKELRINEFTEEEKEAKKAERASLSQEEKQALRQEEQESVETESVTISIPVGVLMLKGSGAADGENITAELSEVKSGTYLSIWTLEDGTVEAVKLKGVN